MSKKYLAFLMIVACAVLAMASPIITQIFPTVSPYVTSNDSVELEWNITEANLKEIKYHWNGTNYTQYNNSNELILNFDNRSSLGESGSLVYDISGNGRNGTVTNAIWNSTGGKYNGAYEFDGNGDYINFGDIGLNYSLSRTFTIWVKLNTLGSGNQQLIGDNLNSINKVYGIYTTDEGRLMYYCTTSSGHSRYKQTETDKINAQEWTHVTIVLDKETDLIRMFINNEEMTSFDGNYDISECSTVGATRLTTIGSERLTGAFLNGTIDDVRIYNRTLTDGEIQNVYLSSLTKYDNEDWNYYVNQSVLISNATGYNYDYYICSTNSSDYESCGNTSVITRLPTPHTVDANFSNEIGEIRENFYGTSIQHKIWFGENGTYLDLDDDGSYESLANYTWNREQFLASGMTSFRQDMELASYYSNSSDGSVNRTGDLDFNRDQIKWAYENDIEAMLVIDYMPLWLANNSDGFCTSNLGRCPPLNYTQYNNLVLDYINYVTLNGTYIDTIILGFWNEPDLGTFWLPDEGQTDFRRDSYFNFYNKTYDGIKEVYPNVSFGGIGIAALDTAYRKSFVTSFIGNFSDKMDYFDFHDYYEFYDDNIDWIVNNCTYYGANCSRIIVGEFNTKNVAIQNTTASRNQYNVKIAEYYENAINTYPSNITFSFHLWSERHRYNNTAYYTEYPNLYAMITQPELVISDQPQYKAPYNTTKQFATQSAQPVSTVYTSTSSSSAIKTVSTKKNGNFFVTVINTNTEAKNITIDTDDSFTELINLETGEIFYSTTGEFNVGVMDQYDILYFGSSPQSEFIAEDNIYYNTSIPIIRANITGQNNLTNATIFIYDENGTLINQTKEIYENGTKTTIFTWIGNLVDGAYTWVIKVWDDLVVETVSTIYNFFVDTGIPEIEYVYPTPENNTVIYQDNFFVNYTVNDTNNMYSFINLDSSLLGWYRFEGDYEDESGYENPTTFTGTQKLINNSVFGEAYNFDGTSNRITTVLPEDITEDITMSAWFKLDSFGDYKRIVAKSTSSNFPPYSIHAILLDSSATNKVRMELAEYPFQQRVLQSSSNISINVWYHLVGTYDYSNDTARIYLNGELDNVSYNFLNGNKISSYPFTDLTIASASYAGADLNGSIDEVMIFNRTLLEGEVLSLYNATNTYNNFTNLSRENHSVQAFVVDQAGNKNNEELRIFDLNLFPPSINITAPNETYNIGKSGDNLTLIYNITRTSEDIDLCWYTYNDTTSFINCSENSLNFTYVQGKNNLTVFSNDTLGLTGNETTTWNYIIEQKNITYEESVYEGALDPFELNVIIGDGYTLSQAILEYNNTNYTTSIVFADGEYLVTSSIPAPTVTTDTNFSFGFYLIVSGETYFLNSLSQLVLNTNFGACSGGDDLLLNISLLDEGTRSSLTGDIELNAQLIGKLTSEIVETTNLSFTSVSYAEICLTPNSSWDNYYLDVEIRYDSTDYAPELYNIQRANLSDYPKDLNVFDLVLNDSTEFLVKYQDDSLIPVEGAIVQLQRKYIGSDVFEVVEAPTTSDIGTAIVHVDLNTNLYQATIVKDGEILDIFPNLVFHCENELSGICTENLLGKIDSQNVVTLESLNDFTYLVSEDDNTITTTFSIPSGSPSSINILLTQTDTFGNTSLCNQTITSSAGSIDCTYSDTIGDSVVKLEIKKDENLQAIQSYVIYEDGAVDFLDNNFFIVFILALSLVGMAFSSPEWIVINSVVVLLLGGSLWLLNGMNFVMGLGSILWLVVGAGILIKEISKQEDR